MMRRFVTMAMGSVCRVRKGWQENIIASLVSWRPLPLRTLGLLLIPGLALAAPPAVMDLPLPPPPPPPIQLTPPAMCEAAVTAATVAENLPAGLLASIALRESGRPDPATGRVRPWPWTINFEGAGQAFATKAEAIAAVQAIQAAGGQSIDVGCMQVNLMHHPDAFATLDEAFDPQANAAYAGRFVKALFAAYGDWGTAIAAYHSLTPGVGEPYRDQVVALWHPTDPAVLAKLTFAPLPALIGPFEAVGSLLVGARPIPIGPNMAYRAFVQTGSALPSPAYQAFQPRSAAYADFSPARARAAALRRRLPRVRRRPALDMHVDSGPAIGDAGLVVPKAVIDQTHSRRETARRARTPGDG
jgi:Transglycosylase SLT domain